PLLTKAIRLKPDQVSAYNYRGLAYQATAQLKKALDDFTKAILLDQAYAEAYYNKANTLREMGCLADAKNAVARAIQLNPRISEFY
ncbi:tetratricopeptide repeat protein, partial [Umezakia ovalisporum]|uniref:tetratricopeptide repeat protein n=1 Tax=Umezakia ovalisporum TaxID=75695 RepID=UPI0039C669D2